MLPCFEMAAQSDEVLLWVCMLCLSSSTLSSQWLETLSRQNKTRAQIICLCCRKMEAGQQAPALQMVIFEYIILNYILRQSLEKFTKLSM